MGTVHRAPARGGLGHARRVHELSALLPHGVARRDHVTLVASTSSVSGWLASGSELARSPVDAWPEARVAVALDGAASHGSRDQRERDLRRDTALAALGWVVLRSSYRRLTTGPEGCRREIEAVVRGRLAER